MDYRNLTPADEALVARAAEVIKRNYDGVTFRHTVGAAVRCINGAVYTGVNVYSLHGACAEVIAIGAALSAGEREFECVVAVGGEKSNELYPPCGNCRQFLIDYAPSCEVIVSSEAGPRKVRVADLLPLAYHTEF
ncbi:cytidine deaminase [Ruminococcaceae bacterium OttesenSCG-928-D13]|nr:cytidine deaminase [Ruminococcaceae bacterium OttesenSCG-928-D13]